MRLLIGFIGTLVVAVVLWEAFETIILPRRVTLRVRITRLLYFLTWQPWSAIAASIKNQRRKEKILSFFGPLSLIILLTVWAVCLVLGFGLIHWAARTTFQSTSRIAGIS